MDSELQAGGDLPTPRFTDNDNGTVTDNLTGLIWLKDADCFGNRSLEEALSDVSIVMSGVCGLTDGSLLGDWRLPNIRELQSLIDYGRTEPAKPPGHPFSNWDLTYWSSTSLAQGENIVASSGFYVNFNQGGTMIDGKGGYKHVWPVRGGQ